MSKYFCFSFSVSFSFSFSFLFLFLFHSIFLLTQVEGSIFLTNLVTLINNSLSTPNPSSQIRRAIDGTAAQVKLEDDDDLDIQGFCLISIVNNKEKNWERRKAAIAHLSQFEKHLFLSRVFWNPIRFTIIHQISNDFPSNPEMEFLFPHHLTLFKKILSKRLEGRNIPNCIVREYLYFILEHYINIPTQSGTLSDLNSSRFVTLVCEMVTKPIEPDLLSIALQHIQPDVLFKYYTQKVVYENLLSRFKSHLNENCIEMYYTIMDLLPLLPCDIEIGSKNHWISMSPLYRLLTLSPTTDPHNQIKQYLFSRLPILLPTNWLYFFNRFLHRSRFNSTFGLTQEAIHYRCELFWQIVKTRIPSLLELLKVAIASKYIFILEAACIYSHVSKTLTLTNKQHADEEYNVSLTVQQLDELLYLSFAYFNCSLTISLILITFHPEITPNIIDKVYIQAYPFNLLKLGDYQHKIILLKRVLLVISDVSFQSSESDQIWNIPRKWKSYLETNCQHTHIDDTELFYSGRVYLARRLGIPITVTAFRSDIGEDVQWSELIDFINFFIDRECAIRNLSSIDPSSFHVTTEDD